MQENNLLVDHCLNPQWQQFLIVKLIAVSKKNVAKQYRAQQQLDALIFTQVNQLAKGWCLQVSDQYNICLQPSVSPTIQKQFISFYPSIFYPPPHTLIIFVFFKKKRQRKHPFIHFSNMHIYCYMSVLYIHIVYAYKYIHISILI